MQQLSSESISVKVVRCVDQRTSKIFSTLFSSQIQNENRTNHTANHTRLFLVTSLEKLNYRRRSIRLFALFLDATAYWHRIILVLCACVGVSVWSTGDDGQGMVHKYIRRNEEHIPLYTHFSPVFSLSLVRFVVSSVSHFSSFSCSFFLIILSQSLSQHKHMHAADTCRQTDRQNWSHQFTHEIHHYYRTYLRSTCV